MSSWCIHNHQDPLFYCAKLSRREQNHNACQSVVRLHLYFFFFHYKKSRGIRKAPGKSVPAASSRAAQPRTEVLGRAEGRRVWSPRERRVNIPTLASTCSTGASVASDLWRCCRIGGVSRQEGETKTLQLGEKKSLLYWDDLSNKNHKQ